MTVQKHRKHIPASGLVIALTATSLLLSALALLSFGGWAWWALDLIAAFRLHLTVALVLILFCSMAARARLGGVAAFSALVLSMIDIYDVRENVQGGHEEKPVSLVIANVGEQKFDPASFAQILSTSKADLVMLQEASPLLSAAGLDLSRFPHRAAMPWQQEGLLLLSRFPFLAVRSLTIGPYGRGAIVATVDGDFGILHVVLIHAPAPRSHSTFRFQQRYLDVIADLPELGSGNVIVAGDFGSAPWSLAMKRFVRRSGLYLASPIATWPASLGRMGLPIDHVLVGSDLCVGVSTSDIGSDHLPLIAQVGRCRNRIEEP